MNSVKKNFIYNIAYQIISLLIPLVTAPYFSRVIGAEGTGIYSYTSSIVYYFQLFILLGVNNYGNRMIAKAREDKKKLSSTFWSIYLFQLLMGIIMLCCYLSYIFIFDNEYKTIALIESLCVVSSILDINWLFFGLEEFKKTVTRSAIVRIINLVLIFLLVKSSGDLWKYTLIMSSMTLLSQVILWGFIKGRINFEKVSFKDIKQHIKPNLILFIPVIAVSLYKVMDKVMLGVLSNVTEVGYYENAEKIVNIPMTLIGTLGTVMLPRISNIMEKGDKKRVDEYITKSINFVMFLSFAMCAGLICIGYDFAPLFFGSEFQKTGILIMLLSVTMPFLAFANVIRTQYLIPYEKDKVYIISVSLGAVVNFIINSIFIPKFLSVGACVGTIFAEIIVMVYQTLAVKKEIDIEKNIKNIIPFLVKSFVMLVVVYLLNFLIPNKIIKLLIQIIFGCIIYGILNIKYILSIIDIKSILKSKKENLNEI